MAVVKSMLIILIFDIDFATAFSATIACITNSGPGNTQILGPAGNYGVLNSGVKALLAFTMILGRLEVLTVLVVFGKSFWHK